MRIEAVGFVFLGDGANVVQLNLGAVGLVFFVDGANLVKSAFLPFLFARFEPRPVRPDHAANQANRVAKTTGEEGFAVAASAATRPRIRARNNH